MNSAREMCPLGHRAEKLTNGCDNMATGDLDKLGAGAEQRVEVQLEEMRRQWAKLWKRPEITL